MKSIEEKKENMKTHEEERKFAKSQVSKHAIPQSSVVDSGV